MTVDDLLAKQEIIETLYRYCRSLDRMDEKMYETVFSSDARLKYDNYFDGTSVEFCEWVWEQHRAMRAHSHQIANVLVNISEDRNRAVSESYVTICLAQNVTSSDGMISHTVERGRYLDQWGRGKSGEWRITGRQYTGDVRIVLDSASEHARTVSRERTDPSYEIFALI